MTNGRVTTADLIERDYYDALGRRHRMPDEFATRLTAALEHGGDGHHPIMATPHAARCYLPAWDRAWGIAAQLYGLRSTRNWGIGDFTDLKRLIELAGAAGADFVGVNPLHALYAADPSRISPYSPSSREFINVLYLDPSVMIGSAESGAARAAIASRSLQGVLARQRDDPTVGYAEISAAKQSIFRLIFETFEHRVQAAPHDAAITDFAAYTRARGSALHNFALYQTLSSLVGFGPDWTNWPAEFRDPASAAVAEFAKHHVRDLRYHAFLQWQADHQLDACARTARAAGMRVGLYLDLALGCAPDSAEGWERQAEIVPGFHVGAPPDDWNANGQDWGLFVPNPEAFARTACSAYRRIAAANMIHAGAVRIDHVLGLNRLFVVPAGDKPAHGAYLRMPFEALRDAIAAESITHDCIVVGEDLGTVPPDLPPRLTDAGILSYRLLIFMRETGRYFAPAVYPHEALVATATHDLPTWRGFWEGRDIAVKHRLGTHPAALSRNRALAIRSAERDAIREAFIGAGLDPTGDKSLIIAAHRFIARTPCRLAVVQLEDLAQEIDQVNLPGAPAGAYPSFARKLSHNLETIFTDQTASAILAAMRAERPHQASAE